MDDARAIPTTDDERRYFIARTSDELCTGRAAYHAKFLEIVDNRVLIRDFYDYLMAYPTSAHIGRDDIPITKHQRELNNANRPPNEQWVYALALPESTDSSSQAADSPSQAGSQAGSQTPDTLWLTTDQAFERFKTFCVANNISVNVTKTSFATQLGQAKIEGVKNRKSNASDVTLALASKVGLRGWAFDLTTLRKAAKKKIEDNEHNNEANVMPDYLETAMVYFSRLDAVPTGGWQQWIDWVHDTMQRPSHSRHCPSCLEDKDYDLGRERLLCDECFPTVLQRYEDEANDAN